MWMWMCLWGLAALALCVCVCAVARFGIVRCPHCGRRVLRWFVVCTFCGGSLRS